MLKSDAAAYLAGVAQKEGAEASAPTNLHAISGEAFEDSADGAVKLLVDGIAFTEDDQQYIEIETLGGISEGDEVTVILSGENGKGMTPLAIGSVGSIDGINGRVKEIEADYIKVSQLDAEVANIGYLKAESAVITDLQANKASIEDLEAVTGRIDHFEADYAKVEDLEANYAKITELDVEKGRIDELVGKTADYETVRADSAKIHDLTAEELHSDHATIGSLDALYAKIDGANIIQETVRNSWIDRLMVQTGLIAYDGTIYSLDAIKVNANNITAGTIDVERLIVTVNGQKYLMHIDTSTGYPTYEKLDGNVIEDLTISADKIMAGAITAEKITTANIEGPGGWINLRNGTFSYANAETGDGISWDGRHLRIGAAALVGSANVDDISKTVNEIHYDHSYTYNDQTQSYTFTASVTKAGADVTNEYDADFFVWYLKTETDTTLLGHGKVMVVPANNALYTGTVLGALEDYLEYEIVDSSGDVISTNSGDDIKARIVWEV